MAKKIALGAAFWVAAVPLWAQASHVIPLSDSEEKSAGFLEKEVRHQLSVLPFYSVFDHVVCSVDGDKVTLSGQVLRPTLKADAETAVRNLEGVGTVTNQIEVLPVSPRDDELRRGIYRAIFEDAVLARYAVQPVPPIHIIVKNGAVTLEGWVESDADKKLAASKVSGVANLAGMKNDLLVRTRERAGK